MARIYGGGGADIGWATSLNGGISWTNGYLPGLTEYGPGGGPNSAASDAAVAYDAKHGMWLICTLPIGNYDTVAVSSSSDGIHWNNPVYVIQNRDADKNWIACDNTPTSPYYGNCYVEFDNPDVGDLLYMSTSHDGGQTWSTPVTTGNSDYGIGGNPIVQPNGTVVVPFADFNCGMSAFNVHQRRPELDGRSRNCLRSQPWTRLVICVAPACLPPPSTARVRCTLRGPIAASKAAAAANDIVYSSSTDGVHWSAKVRIPLDPIGSGVDHFINGMGIDIRTSGSTAHMGMTYYYYPVSNCGSSCTLVAGLQHLQQRRNNLDCGPPLVPQIWKSAGCPIPSPATWSPITWPRYFPREAGHFRFMRWPLRRSEICFQEAIFTSSYGYHAGRDERAADEFGGREADSRHQVRPPHEDLR